MHVLHASKPTLQACTRGGQQKSQQADATSRFQSGSRCVTKMKSGMQEFLGSAPADVRASSGQGWHNLTVAAAALHSQPEGSRICDRPDRQESHIRSHTVHQSLTILHDTLAEQPAQKPAQKPAETAGRSQGLPGADTYTPSAARPSLPLTQAKPGLRHSAPRIAASAAQGWPASPAHTAAEPPGAALRPASRRATTASQRQQRLLPQTCSLCGTCGHTDTPANVHGFTAGRGRERAGAPAGAPGC